VDRFLALDADWRKIGAEIDALRNEQKKLGEARDIEGAKKLKEQAKEKESVLTALDKERAVVWSLIPNLPTDDSPPGKDESANKVLRTWGTPPTFGFQPLDHLALGEKLGLINMEKASEVAGARFTYLMGDLVLLEFALVQHSLRLLTDPSALQTIAETIKPGYDPKPFIPVVPPVMMRPDVFREMARLRDDNADDIFYIPSDDLYLIGSAEHTLGPPASGARPDRTAAIRAAYSASITSTSWKWSPSPFPKTA
jgi:seryl-tRNA synthetase